MMLRVLRMPRVPRMSRMPRMPRMPRIIVRVAQLAIISVALASLTGLIAWHLPSPSLWALDLFNHLRAHYLLLMLVAALLVGLDRRWRWLLVALLIASIDAVLIGPLYLGSGRPAGTSDARLRLLHFNLLSSNTAHSEVVHYLAASGADLLFLQEVSPSWAERLQGVPGYQNLASKPRSDNFGIAILAAENFKVETLQGVDLGAEVPALRVDVHLGDELVSILSVHTLPPVSAEYARRRDLMLRNAAAWAERRRRAGALPVIIGDLNATPFSGPLRALVADGGLVDSARGFGLQPSWPAGAGVLSVLLAIPIDHALHDPGLTTLGRELGPELGSDHRPLQIELMLALALEDGDGDGS